MKRSFVLSLCAVALAAFTLTGLTPTDARADDIDITLEFGGGDWELYAEVITPGGGTADGSLGISAIRALIDNIDFGTNGDGVTIASGIGAINPIDAGGANERPPVLDMGGTLDIIYGQDISTTGTIVGGVGVGGRDLIASGTYSGIDPAFGVDGSLTSQGLFLTSTTPGGGNAIDPDANNLFLVPVVDDFFLPGDANNDGFVTGADVNSVSDNFGAVGAITPHLPGDANHDGFVTGADVNSVSDNFGNVALSGISAVPEPSSLLLAVSLFSMLGFAGRRRKSC